MRFAVLGLWHETNTFSPVPADYAAFEADALLRGEAIVAEYRDSQATVAGFLQAAGELGFEAVPLIHARTGPIGLVTADAFDRIVGEMLALLRGRGPWDGVLLANHGAAVCEAHADVDGEIARRVRELVGPDVPIGIGLDLHANLTPAVVRHTTVATVYQTNPHLDARERARECAETVWRAARGEVRPVQWLETPPLVVSIVRQCTDEEPMRGVIADAAEAAARDGLLSASAVEGYPYADVPQMGMSFLAVADGDQTAARDAARWMAQRAWARRDEMVSTIPSPRAALERARAAARRPLVVMDVGDNVLGGSAADSTVLLAEARRLGMREVLQALYDPGAVRRCEALGAGAAVALEVGARTDTLHGAPLPIRGRVVRIDDGRYHGGFRYFDDGRRAVVETDDGLTLVLTSNRAGSLSREQFHSVGLRPESFRVVIAKGVVSPRAAYEPIAAEIVLADTPGLTTADLSTFDYRRRRRPLFPFETDARYE
jgi:microcystin degradation protein MlrC